MKNKIFTIFRIAVSVLLVLFVIYGLRHTILMASQVEEAYFQGSGTLETPYRITDAKDLAKLAELVNAGERFSDIYFEQTANIDLAEFENWTPIGVFDGDSYFEGIYDGNYHYIDNLVITSDTNVGLFGYLNGIVCNLGINSGSITGSYVGSIACWGDGIIANCWNKADLYGNRTAGICDGFTYGKVICCWNSGQLNSAWPGGITSCTAGQIYGCAANTALTNENFGGTIKDSQISEDGASFTAQYLKQANYDFDLKGIVLKNNW